MLTSGEIGRGTQGALRFLQRDPSAPFYFENSVQACLRSFWVMVLVAPLYALYVIISYSGLYVAADEIDIALVEALRYLVDWLLYPVLFYEIARHRRWLDRYPRYIGALNWISLPAMGLLLADALVANVTPMPFPMIFDIALQALLFYWIATTTRMVLGVNWLVAGLLLIVNWVPSLFLSLIVNQVLGVSTVVGS
ncbi:hypothetical protein SAMN02745126_02356 [Enhydrobacter aerosaccus]|uniref:Yip1 domain-containing protein n=1 Tax=Enhydrobacter aerosaccus TaxID=225324 RepID=A0A1T4NMS2_9HYPH|nr:hypothetical protein [Enhydrobacter aerosaccus]SJZ80387.1 hypothetical protein SAMN02745126_02356 [Enhydrobacter aerosaccus]